MATDDDAMEQCTHLALRGNLAQRVGDAGIGIAALVTSRLTAALFFALAIHPQLYAAHPSTDGRILASVLGIATYAFGLWGRRQLARARRFAARLDVSSDNITITYGGLLYQPVTVRRANVRAVDIRSGQLDASTPRGRLWRYYSRLARTPLALLAPQPRVPNLALLFDVPVDFAGGRPRIVGETRPAARELGVLMAVRDTRAAQRVFEPWGVVRELNADDLACIEKVESAQAARAGARPARFASMSRS